MICAETTNGLFSHRRAALLLPAAVIPSGIEIIIKKRNGIQFFQNYYFFYLTFPAVAAVFTIFQGGRPLERAKRRTKRAKRIPNATLVNNCHHKSGPVAHLGLRCCPTTIIPFAINENARLYSTLVVQYIYIVWLFD